MSTSESLSEKSNSKSGLSVSPTTVILSLFAAFQAISISDNVLAWRDFFTNLLKRWDSAKSILLQYFPGNLSETQKEYILFSIIWVSIFLFAIRIALARSFNVEDRIDSLRLARRIFLTTIFSSTIWFLLWGIVIVAIFSKILIS